MMTTWTTNDHELDDTNTVALVEATHQCHG